MKIIELSNDYLIVCDNPKCDYKLENPTKDAYADISGFVNMACPKCGENLLTEKDYYDSLILLKFIGKINKWFGWLAIFPFLRPKKKVAASVHVYNGIKIEKQS